jgi:hypothetical protein
MSPLVSYFGEKHVSSVVYFCSSREEDENKKSQVEKYDLIIRARQGAAKSYRVP